MNEDQLRILVRQVVAERIAARAPAAAPRPLPLLQEPAAHSSHGLLRMAPPVEQGQPCIVEPHVACALCGFCQSLGH